MQSSNTTTLLAISFVSQQLIALSLALVIMLGADVGTALMARILTFDLGWLSPLLLLCSIVAFLSNRKTRVGQLECVGIGLGLILLALELIIAAAAPITHSSAILVIFTSISDDTLLALLLGAVFAMVSYSSLATVLLTATLAATALLPLKMALCIVIGANLGSGVLAILGGRGQSASARQLVLGSMLFKIIGCVLILPWLAPLAQWIGSSDVASDEAVIYFHVVYNLLRCLLMLPLVTSMARLCRRLVPHEDMNNATAALRYLDNSALDTPSLALANAVRETLRLGDVVAQMLERFRLVLFGDREQKREISRLDEEANMLHKRHQALSGTDSSRRFGRGRFAPLGGSDRHGVKPETSRRHPRTYFVVVHQQGAECSAFLILRRHGGTVGTASTSHQFPLAGDVGVSHRRHDQRQTPAPGQTPFDSAGEALLPCARRTFTSTKSAESGNQLAAHGAAGGYSPSELAVLRRGLSCART